MAHRFKGVGVKGEGLTTVLPEQILERNRQAHARQDSVTNHDKDRVDESLFGPLRKVSPSEQDQLSRDVQAILGDHKDFLYLLRSGVHLFGTQRSLSSSDETLSTQTLPKKNTHSSHKRSKSYSGRPHVPHGNTACEDQSANTDPAKDDADSGNNMKSSEISKTKEKCTEELSNGKPWLQEGWNWSKTIKNKSQHCSSLRTQISDTKCMNLKEVSGSNVNPTHKKTQTDDKPKITQQILDNNSTSMNNVPNINYSSQSDQYASASSAVPDAANNTNEFPDQMQRSAERRMWRKVLPMQPSQVHHPVMSCNVSNSGDTFRLVDPQNKPIIHPMWRKRARTDGSGVWYKAVNVLPRINQSTHVEGCGNPQIVHIPNTISPEDSVSARLWPQNARMTRNYIPIQVQPQQKALFKFRVPNAVESCCSVQAVDSNLIRTPCSIKPWMDVCAVWNNTMAVHLQPQPNPMLKFKTNMPSGSGSVSNPIHGMNVPNTSWNLKPRSDGAPVWTNAVPVRLPTPIKPIMTCRTNVPESSSQQVHNPTQNIPNPVWSMEQWAEYSNMRKKNNPTQPKNNPKK